VTGSNLCYRAGVSGSFTVTASGSTDAESGLSAYVFPTPATWTVTGSGASRTYAWTPTSTQTGTLGVHGVDVAGNSGPDATFAPTADAAAPTTSDNTSSLGSGWQTSGGTVTPTVTMGTLPAVIHAGQTLTASASDTGSGVATVAYYYCSPSPCTPNTLIGSSSNGPSYSLTWTTQPPDGGAYDVVARATDNAGN